MSVFHKLLASYNYNLPVDCIAKTPAIPRPSAKLLVVEKKNNKLIHDTFFNLGKYLPPQAVLVLNNTKVMPARLYVTKPTGGKVELLYIESKNGKLFFLANRQLKINDELLLKKGHKFKVIDHQGSHYTLEPMFKIGKLADFFIKYGYTPLPPYLKDSPLSEKYRRTYYQTVFAHEFGSVAAPTASLHFTKKLLADLKKQGIALEYVTLHVNLGTFAPLQEENIKKQSLHLERYFIEAGTAERLMRYKKQGRPIIAVGTTVARTLESASSARGKLRVGSNTTQLFISPGYKWKFVDGLVTNFHVPKSSLLMLVAGLIGRTKLLNIYKSALKLKYRFFSFGDGMLIRK